MARKSATKKEKGYSIISYIQGFFTGSKPERATTKAAQQPRKSSEQEYTTNGGASSATGSQTQTLTLTNQIQKRLPTLILKLKQYEEQSDEEQEESIRQHVQSFREMLFHNIEEFQAIILSARPSPGSSNDPDYEEQTAAYNELLKLAISLMENLRETLSTVLMKYRILIEDLWEAICAGKDPAPISARFQQETEAYIKEAWDPVFAEADQLMQKAEELKHSDGQPLNEDL